MDVMTINKYLSLPETKLKNLKAFCKDVYNSDYINLNLTDIILNVYYFPSRNNGNLIKIGKKYYVNINLYPIYIKFNSNKAKLYFYLYATLMHELNHIILFENKSFSDYPTWASYFEMKFKTSKKLPALIKKLKLKDNNSEGICYTELLCHKYSFEKSIQLFSTLMQEDELEEINIIFNAVNLSLKCMEADFEGKYTYNKFDFIVRQTKYALKKEKTISVAEDFLWNQKRIKTIAEIFELRNENNYKLIDELLIKYFVNIDSDYKHIFDENPSLEKYLEHLIRQYFMRIEHYLENEKLFCVVLEKREYYENRKLLLQIIRRISNKVSLYNLNVGSHYYIPLL